MIEKGKGFIAVMLTPFKDNGAVDYDGLTQLTEFYMASGAAGLFANCASSEMYKLTEEERLQIVDHVVKVVNGRIPVVATGNFGRDMQEQAAFMNKVYDKGVEAVIIITGLLVKRWESDELLDKNFFTLLDLTGKMPLGFYECPSPYTRLLCPEQLGRFVDSGRVIYHKDTSLDLDVIRAKNLACAAHKDFGLYDVYMAHAVASLKAGSAGLSCIQGNYVPELVVWLCKNYNNSHLATEVDLVQQFFINEMGTMHNQYPKAAKYYLQQQGMKISTFTRNGNPAKFTDDVRKGIVSFTKRYEELKNMIKLK
jgi:4-hydroxy-tetrahydrodipicolinate synthase